MTRAACIAEFRRALDRLSYVRAGLDYHLTPAQRAREARMATESLARLRDLWRQHPSLHTDMRAAFKEAGPLATMAEIEREAAA